ncbi:MAG: glycoside hydrolase family 57 [Gammaproteobacteria bacterium]|jgi:alpha-amylase/alpha-mannosidase (GH57 family)|nr:glycoside hydrolase family 57 [Gammaproteobacteria bacterium]
MPETFHALVLNLHQPPDNLQQLLDHKEWEAREILYAIDRIPRSLWDFEDVARVHLSISGTLLETLSNEEFQHRVYGIVDCGSLLWRLQNERVLQILGTGYYHPVLPLIPKEDWADHLERWLGIGRHLFWRSHFPGFWPPEMAFTMEMIPLLKRLGYRYVMVDSEHVEPVTPMRWEEVRYRPHIAQFGGEEIVVIVRDRELSDAQEAGMEYEWFAREVQDRARWCDFPALVTTCTDGENGGWFRNVSPEANFWGYFFRTYMEHVRAGDSPMRPTFITDYLDRYGAHGVVNVRTAAWNTGWHHGRDFVQWTGSAEQRECFTRVTEVSRAVHEVRSRVGDSWSGDPQLDHELEEATWHLLRAETSCNFFWGDAWVHRAHSDLDTALAHAERARALLPP